MTWQEPIQPGAPGQPGRPIELGQDVYSADGQRVGSVAEIEPNSIVITRGPLNPPERLVPRSLITGIDQRGIYLALPLAQIQAEAPAVPAPSASPSPSPTMPSAPYATVPTMAPAAGELPDERVLELKEERLVAHKELRQVGEVEVRTVVEEVPSHLEVDTLREEVVVEHVPIGQAVEERVAPWEDDGTLVIPVYEEQLVVVKRLLLKEELRVRRIRASERQAIDEPVRRERVIVQDLNQTGLVHERYPNAPAEATTPEPGEAPATSPDEQDEGFGGLIKKMFG